MIGVCITSSDKWYPWQQHPRHFTHLLVRIDVSG